MEGKPPKLWLVWIYRNYLTDPISIRKKIEKLFGMNAEVSDQRSIFMRKTFLAPFF